VWMQTMSDQENGELDHSRDRPGVHDVQKGQVVAASSHSSLVWDLLRIPMRWFCSSWLRITASGTENIDPDRGALLLINHESYLDPIVAGVRLNRPVCFLARDTLFRVPVLKWLLTWTFVIPISRRAARSSSIRAAGERLREDHLVGIFPEGTRSAAGATLEFRPGFLAIARRTDQPVHPVGIAGSGLALPRDSFWLRPRRIHVHYGPSLSAEMRQRISAGDDDQKLCEDVRLLVQEQMRRSAEQIRS